MREVKQYSEFLPLPSRTLHDLLRNIFTKILFTDLLQSLSSSWLKWLVLDQFTARSHSQRNRLEILSSSLLFFLFRLDPVTKEEKTKGKLKYDITLTKWCTIRWPLLSNTQISLIVHYYLPVKYVTESRRNISVHLFQSHRLGMGEELQDERINKLIAERKLRQVWWKPETSWNVKRCIMCSEKRRVFRERISKKTVSCEEQIMSKDKHPSIFSRHIEAIVFIIPQIYYATHAVLKIGKYSRIFPSLSWGIFGHVTRLGQSHVSKKIWWIITNNYSISALWL